MSTTKSKLFIAIILIAGSVLTSCQKSEVLTFDTENELITSNKSGIAEDNGRTIKLNSFLLEALQHGAENFQTFEDGTETFFISSAGNAWYIVEQITKGGNFVKLNYTQEGRNEYIPEDEIFTFSSEGCHNQYELLQVVFETATFPIKNGDQFNFEGELLTILY